jgi:hypothetical protein
VAFRPFEIDIYPFVYGIKLWLSYLAQPWRAGEKVTKLSLPRVEVPGEGVVLYLTVIETNCGSRMLLPRCGGVKKKLVAFA